ncbi:MAG: N-methyl-L-tryptophan oxidase [Planctomycetota bacterium]|nr:N-methyl-L-tryptophan oxidase [Planctomycetota bacterium]MDA1113499.1 N-methyl-L-tryptophan oxidase [Planctomycetota bacterium]
MAGKSMDAEVLVLGVGSMGAATCLSLARRGVSVLGVDAYSIPNQRASHHGTTRMMRLSYYEHPSYVALLKEAWDLWRALEQECGASLLNQTGALYFGHPDGALIRGTLQAAEQHDLPHQLLQDDALHRAFPAFSVPEDCVGVLDERAGYVYSEHAVKTIANRAVAYGARLVQDCPIETIEYEEDHIVFIAQSGERFHAKHLVVTAGAGASATSLGVLPCSVEVTRQALGWFDVLPGQDDPAQNLPCWAMEASALNASNPGLLYGFPARGDVPQLKAALHLPGAVVDAHTPLTSEASALQPVEMAMRSLLPELSGKLSHHEVCRYTNSSDGHFRIGRHAEKPNTTVATGFSGHGFKFVPVMGEILAELCLEGGSTRPIDFLNLYR